MAAKTPKKTQLAKTGGRLPGVLDGTETESEGLARLITHSAGAVTTVQQYARASDRLDTIDLMRELRRVGDEAVDGDLSRFEHMLATQALSLDVLFHDLMQRAGRQGDLKSQEVLMRLALKAQAQTRATIETLAAVKNPVPYIRQANIAQGHQQVNNGPGSARVKKRKSAPIKVMETSDERLECGATAAAVRTDPALETVGAGHGAPD